MATETRKKLLLSAVLPAFALLANPAQARVDDVPAADQSGLSAADEVADRDLDQTIVVTAQRRAQDKQDVPVTLTVIGAEAIQDGRVQSVQDIVARTPGFGFDSFPQSEPRLSIRGVGSSSRGAGGDPSTAIFIDEVYYGRPAAITFETYDVARVEVLKGPQGTLFGRNVAGGAISVVSQRPRIGEFDASLEGSYGSYNRIDGLGFVNVPLGDQAAFRMTATYRSHDGYVDRVVDGTKVGELDDQETVYLRGQLAVEPAPNLSINLKVDYLDEKAGGPGNRVIADLGDGGLSGLFLPTTERNQNAATFDGQQDRTTWGIRGETELDLGFGSLRYIGSYRQLDYVNYYDFDGAPPAIEGLAFGIEGGATEATDFYSNEVQLRSPASSDINWVIGLYQYHAETERDSPTYLTVNGDTALFDLVYQDASIESKAIYADVTVPLSEQFSVFGGMRYTKDNKQILSSGDTNDPGSFYTIGDPATPGYYSASAKDSWDAFTWRAGIHFKLSPDHMVYASVSRGFKSGGFQDTPANTADLALSYNPEFATNYEIGNRSSFLNGNLIWNNSVYFTQYTDLQTRIPSGLGFRADNASAEIYGLESELSLRLGGFRVSASYAYTHARYTDFLTVEDGVDQDYAGNHLTRVPEHKFTLSPSYELELGSGASFKIGADWAHEGLIYDDHSNLPPEIREPTDFVDAYATLASDGGKWEIGIWGKNLTNVTTRTYQGVFGGVLFGAYNPPRTYGATLRWNY